MTATIRADHPTLEVYARRYPGVPYEVILKEDLLRRGFTLTDAAMEAARGCRTQAYYLFSYNISGHSDLKKGMSTAALKHFRVWRRRMWNIYIYIYIVHDNISKMNYKISSAY